MKRIFLIGVAALLISPLLMKKSTSYEHDAQYVSPEAARAAVEVPPLVLRTSLEDTMSSELMTRLGLKNTYGTKLRFRDGSFASYFEYKAPRAVIVQMLSLLPVSFNAMLADTTYRKMRVTEFEELMTSIPFQERQYADFFWAAPADDVEVFECLKPPFRHIVLVNKRNDTILHRIEGA